MKNQKWIDAKVSMIFIFIIIKIIKMNKNVDSNDKVEQKRLQPKLMQKCRGLRAKGAVAYLSESVTFP